MPINLQTDSDNYKYDVDWSAYLDNPQLKYLKDGKAYTVALRRTEAASGRRKVVFEHECFSLLGSWDEPEGCFGSIFKLMLKNKSCFDVQPVGISFPGNHGLREFLRGSDIGNVSFLSNGYQSWTESGSYRINERQKKPISIFNFDVAPKMSHNMASLPSGINSRFHSEIYAMVTKTKEYKSFFIGQLPVDKQPAELNHLFYINIKLDEPAAFEVVFDLEKISLKSGESVELDRVILAVGDSYELQKNYFIYLNQLFQIKRWSGGHTGWCTWYFADNDITFDKIIANLDKLSSMDIHLDYIQLDDGYQKEVGDWLDLKEDFDGKMKQLTEAIVEYGAKPGIWIAPFIAHKRSKLFEENPSCLLRDKRNRPVKAGWNIHWNKRWSIFDCFYAIDVTNEKYQENLRSVINKIVNEWGFKMLKLDFTYAACLNQGVPKIADFSKADLLQKGLEIIRNEANDDVLIIGCGMPLSPSIGKIDVMRIGCDTDYNWNPNRLWQCIFQTNAIPGLKNNMKNMMVRSMMNMNLWINDPDCILSRKRKKNKYEHMTDIDLKIVSGGFLMFSDDFTIDDYSLETNKQLLHRIIELCNICYGKEAIALDLYERNYPRIFFNKAGYISFLNETDKYGTFSFELIKYINITGGIHGLQDVWDPERFIQPGNGCIKFENMPPHSSELFRIL